MCVLELYTYVYSTSRRKQSACAKLINMRRENRGAWRWSNREERETPCGVMAAASSACSATNSIYSRVSDQFTDRSTIGRSIEDRATELTEHLLNGLL